MAKATKYRIEFSDIDGGEYRIDLKYEDYVGGIKVLDGTGTAVGIEYEKSENKFQPINGSGATFNFYNDGTVDVKDFFAIGIYDISVVVEKSSAGGFWERCGLDI